MSLIRSAKWQSLSSLRQVFGGLSMSGQFAITSGAIMFVAVLLAGSFISSLVAKAAIGHKAAASALLVDSLIIPHLLNAADGVLTPEAIAGLDAEFGQGTLSERFPHVDMWAPDGTLIYARDHSLIGRTFERPEGLALALQGQIVSRYTDLTAQEHTARNFAQPFLEIYVPLRNPSSVEIFGVAEIHEVQGPIHDQLFVLRLQTWLAVAGVAALMMFGLYWIVRRGEKTIAAQKAQLTEHLAQVEDISRQNLTLRRDVEFASGRVSELIERQLQGVGADLHDGPAQLVALALLNLDHLRWAGSESERVAEIDRIEMVLCDSLDDIRKISRGLLAPEFEELSLPEVVCQAVSLHQQRTGSAVSVHSNADERPASAAVKICLFRFIQEGLNNAYRHTTGVGQSVTCRLDEQGLEASVETSGSNHFDPTAEGGMGLIGLRHRVVSLGGTFSFCVLDNGATRLFMALPLDQT